MRSPLLIAAAVIACLRFTAALARADVTLAAVGDVMMARGVAARCRQAGWDYPFSGAARSLKGADLVFGNLECPVSARGVRQERRYSFRAEPACLAAIKRAGFNLLSVANNHAMDYGRPALADTLRGMRGVGMRPIGGGDTYADALAGTVMRTRGLRVGFLGFSAFPRVAGGYAPAQPSIAVMSDQRLAARIRALRKRCDVVVVSCHWGVEGRRAHSAVQEHLGRLAIDAGASLVLGHHPHVPQEIERYKRGVIVYSLGNFVFDEPRHTEASGLIFRCVLGHGGVESWWREEVRIERCRPVSAGARVAGG